MRLLNLLAAVVVLALLAGPMNAGVAHAANYDFRGFAHNPSMLGDTVEALTILTNNGVIATPIPLDFLTREHTLVIRGTLVFEDANVQQFSPATVDVYTDVIASGTAADFANPPTFEDGTLILSGVFAVNLTRNKFTPQLTNLIGAVNWIGGSRLGELGADTLEAPFVAGTSTQTQIPSGYDEDWDGFIGESTSIAVEQRSWSIIKGFYRD